MYLTFPYRNTVKFGSNWELDPTKTYIQKPDFKPIGLWYEIDDSIFKWGVMDWGKNIYTINLKDEIINQPKGLKSITSIDELKEFQDTYECKDYLGNINIDWKRVSQDYGGFEIKNYSILRKELYSTRYAWFYLFDFSSGCIWNLDLIQEVKFYKTLTEEEIENKKDFS